MCEKIFIGVAWPYSNGYLHLGHLAGCYIAADVFARYHRLRGNKVLMVSGSDQHGTPVTLRAEEEGVTPNEIAEKYHRHQTEAWDRLGVTFDLFTTTGTANHRKVVQDMFLALKQKGLIYKDVMSLPYCDNDNRFLPDRYVEGVCPYCGNTSARGDQCDKCGKPMDPVELGHLRCRICGNSPKIKESEHFFLRLSALQDDLLAWTRKQHHWRRNVLNFTKRYLEDGLHDRAITRDIDWGIPVPVPGYEDKRIYVWFEAVVGYLSAAQEWAQNCGKPTDWEQFWHDSDAKAYYFLGKDNIAFHTIIWPGMLMGYGGLNLPYDVPANEFMNLKGGKFSKSEHWAVWVHDYLERYQPDPLRYYITANMPETSDAEFTWHDFVRRNNDELVATFGNLVNRVLTFLQRNFDGYVPEHGDLDIQGQALLSQIDTTLDTVGQNLEACHFREALKNVMSLAQETNRYLDNQAPWRTLREDRPTAATSLWVTLCAISGLKTMTFPFIPFSSQQLHKLLGFTSDPHDIGWKIQYPLPGQLLPKPYPLFVKLDESVAEEENMRMQQETTG